MPKMIAAQDKNEEDLEQWIPIILSAQSRTVNLQTAFTLRDTSRWHEDGPRRPGQS